MACSFNSKQGCVWKIRKKRDIDLAKVLGFQLSYSYITIGRKTVLDVDMTIVLPITPPNEATTLLPEGV